MSDNKILVVDDDRAVSAGVKMTLEKKYDVSTADSALDAFDHLANNKVDLVLLDIKMPHMNGLEALETIKERYPAIPVVMLTAYPSEKNIQISRALGAQGLLAKPFGVDELRDYVDNAMAEKSD